MRFQTPVFDTQRAKIYETLTRVSRVAVAGQRRVSDSSAGRGSEDGWLRLAVYCFILGSFGAQWSRRPDRPDGRNP